MASASNSFQISKTLKRAGAEEEKLCHLFFNVYSNLTCAFFNSLEIVLPTLIIFWQKFQKHCKILKIMPYVYGYVLENCSSGKFLNRQSWQHWFASKSRIRTL